LRTVDRICAVQRRQAAGGDDAAADEEWSQWSDSEIARRCVIYQTTVSRYRREISFMQSLGEPGLPRTYTTKHGTVTTMKTEAIGRPARCPTTAQTGCRAGGGCGYGGCRDERFGG
jgi:hypothetical protein